MVRAEGLRYDGSYYPTEDYELWARAPSRGFLAPIARVLSITACTGKA
jgi:hypothetical protein